MVNDDPDITAHNHSNHVTVTASISLNVCRKKHKLRCARSVRLNWDRGDINGYRQEMDKQLNYDNVWLHTSLNVENFMSTITDTLETAAVKFIPTSKTGCTMMRKTSREVVEKHKISKSAFCSWK